MFNLHYNRILLNQFDLVSIFFLNYQNKGDVLNEYTENTLLRSSFSIQ